MATVILTANLALLTAMALALGLLARSRAANRRLPPVHVAPPLTDPRAAAPPAAPRENLAA
jgi:hypothetical protein